MAVEIFANQPSTTVSAGGADAPASGTVETWTVASSSSFPAASSAASPPTQFHISDTADDYTPEIIAVTNVSGTTWTVTRGAESTTPITHEAGFTITQVVTAGALGALATLTSPALAGSPTAPTQTTGDTSTKIATDAFVAAAAGAVQTVTATVSPIGTGAGTALPNNGADYGPDTEGTTTSGLQEALTALEATGGKMVLRQGAAAFAIESAMTYTSDYSLTIEGETRGRAENVTSETDAWGVFLLVGGLSSGTFALTVSSNTENLGMLKLLNFTVRGQALGYTGSTSSGVKFLTNGTYPPAQIEIDNVACEFLGVPCIDITNSTNGPVIIGWIGFFYCGGGTPYTIPQLQLTAGTCHIGHIESFEGLNPAVGVTGGGAFCFIDIDSIWCGVNNVFNWGVGAAAPTNTYLHIGSVGAHTPGNSALILLDASGGSLSAHIGKVSWDNSTSGGKIIAGTAESTSGTVQVTIGSLNGNPEYLIWNNSSATVGAGSFLDILSAYFTATPTADIPYANMAENVRLAASSIVTSVAVESANGLAGTVADSTTTPQITLSTSVTGLLKGNGTAIAEAVAGTDYPAVPTLTNFGPVRLFDRNSTAVVAQYSLFQALVYIPAAVTLSGIVICNGTTIAGNVYVGIYNPSGTLLASSALVAQSGSSRAQAVPFGSTYAAAPGVYSLAFVSDSTTADFGQTCYASFASVTTQGAMQIPGTATFPSALDVFQAPAMATY